MNAFIVLRCVRSFASGGSWERIFAGVIVVLGLVVVDKMCLRTNKVLHSAGHVGSREGKRSSSYQYRRQTSKSVGHDCHVSANGNDSLDEDFRDSIDPEKLKRILERARESQSDAVVIWQNGKLVSESYFGKLRGPIEAMSATKSVVSLAFGRLLLAGRLKSLDTPVCEFYPEWKEGEKSKITIFHLLTHMSGIQCKPTTADIYREPDFVKFALRAELVDDPGTRWRYNNKASNLLPGIVEKVSGKRMDLLIGEEIFQPLGIKDWSWSLDKSGNPHGMAGLQIRPEDFAKIGQMMLDGGTWNGQQLIPAEFVSRCVTDHVTPPPASPQLIDLEKVGKEVSYTQWGWGPHYGLLWWVDYESQAAVTDRLLNLWRRNGVDDTFVDRMSRLKGLKGDDLRKRFRDEIGESDYMEHVIGKNQIDWDMLSWTKNGFSAQGFLGQYLVVVPKHRIVAVRMRRSPKQPFDEGSIDNFKEFKKLVAELGTQSDELRK